MVPSDIGQEPPPAATVTPSRDTLAAAMRWMLLARVTEEKIGALYRGGKIHGGVYLGRGQEALSVAAGLSLRRGDVFAPLIRDLAGRLAFGEPLVDGVRTYLGSSLGPMRGRDGNVHRGHPREGLLAMVSHLGAMLAAVNGVLFARRMKGQPGAVGVASIGDGGTSTGACHEALNQAAIEKLPLVVVIANNQFAYSTANDRQFACKALVDRAIGYGVTGWTADGTDVEDCLRVIGSAVEQARAGGGPQLIEAQLLRLCGHGEHDDAAYVPAALRSSNKGRDCLKVAEELLTRRGVAGAEEIASWRVDAIRQVEACVAQVQREPAPDPFREDWCALAERRLAELYPA